MKDILEALAESVEDTTGERDYDLERRINHSSDEELLELLDQWGY